MSSKILDRQLMTNLLRRSNSQNDLVFQAIPIQINTIWVILDVKSYLNYQNTYRLRIISKIFIYLYSFL